MRPIDLARDFFRWDWRRGALLTFAALPLGLLAEVLYRRVPQIPVANGVQPLPSLSVIVPARNEVQNLGRLLPSLKRMRYPGPHEIIVVDDHSTDGTAEIAQAHGARVVSLQAGLPCGWKGKPHACHQGALAAQGEWLLFTDADTVHEPDGPRSVVAYALEHGLDGLSLWLRQEFRGWADRLCLMVAFAGMYASWNSRRPMFNGQYILLRRDAYFASDGYRAPVLEGYRAATVRMYGDFRQMWSGLNRLGSGTLRWVGPRGLLTVLLVSALMSPLIATAGVATGNLRRRWIWTTWLAAVAAMLPWAGRNGALPLALAAPFGALLVQVAAVWGVLSRVLGLGVHWKGRKV
jgi:chlorobactene glucosyltransferase